MAKASWESKWWMEGWLEWGNVAMGTLKSVDNCLLFAYNCHVVFLHFIFAVSF